MGWGTGVNTLGAPAICRVKITKAFVKRGKKTCGSIASSGTSEINHNSHAPGLLLAEYITLIISSDT